MENRVFITLILTLSFLGLAQSADAQGWLFGNPNKTAKSASVEIPVKFISPTVHDYGEVEQGNYPGAEFLFVNNSKRALVIHGFHRTCNLTVPTYTQVAVNPGDTGSFTVIFNPRDISGRFTKDMAVMLRYEDDDTTKYDYKAISFQGKVIRGMARNEALVH